MPKSNSISVSTTNTSHMYSESDESNIEPTIEDIHEFAKRIGIDPIQESHLLDLAKEGLLEKLPPNWKPCFEPHKQAWYYYNLETQSSQWEHPLDSVYRSKVSAIKTEQAMNKIQNFNPTAPGNRNSKNLPPLKIKTATGVIGGLLSLSNDSIKQQSSEPRFGSSNVSSLLRASLESSQEKSSPAAIKSNELQNSNNELFSNNASNNKKQLQPLQSIGRKSSGLTLSGSGASFLKSNSVDVVENVGSSKGLPEQFKKLSKADETQSSSEEMSLKDPIIRRPTSALVNKNPTKTSQPNSTTTAPTGNKKTEKKLWFNLDKSEDEKKGPPHSSKPEQVVKFKLDEDPKFQFDISQNESEGNKRQSEDYNSGIDSTDEAFNVDVESSNDDNDNDQDDEEVGDSSKSKQMKGSEEYSKESSSEDDEESKTEEDKKMQVQIPSKMNAFTKLLGKQLGGASEKQHELNQFSTNQNPIKNSLEQEMEENLKKYQLELDNQRLKREKQMKEHVEQSLSQLQQENEELIKKNKLDLEKSRQAQFDKLKSDMEQILNKEIEKVRSENQMKLEARKRELSNDYEKNMKEIETELKQFNKSTILQQRREELMKEIEKEIQSEVKGLKESMKEEQKKQIQQMRDYHASFISKLKEEFKDEEAKLRQQHSETLTALNKDQEQLISSLHTQHETELQHLKSEYEEKKSYYENELKKIQNEVKSKPPSQSHHANNDSEDFDVLFHHKAKSNRIDQDGAEAILKPKSSVSSAIKKSSELDLKEFELKEIKNKYKNLEDKYYKMKQDLDNVVGATTTHQIKSHKNLKAQNIDELSIGTGAGISTGIEDDDDVEERDEDDHGHEHSSLVQDSVISNISTLVNNINNNTNHQSSPSANANNNNKKISINDIIAGSEDRLSKALSALEHLRDQIIEIKSDQELKLSRKLSNHSIAAGATVANQNSVNVFPTKEVFVYNNHDNTQPLTKKHSSTRIRASVSTSDLHKLNDNPNDGDDDENHVQHKLNNHNRQVVENAKDFIKSQKHRLTTTSEASSPTSSHHQQQQYQYFHSTFPRLRRIDDLVFKDVNNSSIPHSESTTTDSGIGLGSSSLIYNNNNISPLLLDHTHNHHSLSSSLNTKEAKGENRSQVARDIDGILGSLKQLDKQMKYMWSVVGQKSIKRVNDSSIFTTIQSSADFMGSYDAEERGMAGPILLTPLIHPMSSPAMEHLDRLVKNRNANNNSIPKYYWDESSLKYKQLDTNIPKSFEKVQNDGDTRRNPTASILFSNSKLDEHLKHLKNALQSQSNESSNVGFEMASSSLLEKTKDLREWLQNF